MQIDDDDKDDEFFCPRLRWMEENSEDLSLLTFEKRRYDDDVRLLKLLETGEFTVIDVMKHFGWDLSKARRQMNSVRARGVKLNSPRCKKTGVIIYSVKSKPPRLLFRYPSNSSKIKLQ